VLKRERERGVLCPETGTDGRVSKEAVTVATTPHKDAGAGVPDGGRDRGSRREPPLEAAAPAEDPGRVLERAGHIRYSGQPAEVMADVTDFMSADAQVMAVTEGAGPDNRVQETGEAQAGVSLTTRPARTAAPKRQALRDQEGRLLGKGSHAVDWVQATAPGTFWSRLNAIDFMNSSLQFAALAVLCLFPFLIIFSAENGGDARHALIARLGLDQKAAQDVDQLMSSGTHAVTTLSVIGVAVVLLGALGIASTLQA
jgi:hypothetical protein